MKSLFQLNPDITYLNHGSFGACPRQIFAVYQQMQAELEYQPVEFLDRSFFEHLKQPRQALANFLHGKPENLIFVPNATTGLNIVARSLVFKPGDEILTTNHEYGALDRTWQFICSKTGAVCRQVQLPHHLGTSQEIIEALSSAMTTRTKVLFISHITSSTALLMPVEELIRRARQQGILSIIDGAHAPGHIPLDLARLDPDFYAGNCHKWMLTPKGSAFLYCRPEQQPLLEPLVIGWGWQPQKIYESPFIDLLERQGTRDISAFLAIPAAIAFMEEHNWTAVRTACRRLVREAVDLLSGETPLVPVGLRDPKYALQMAAFVLPRCDRETLKKRLYDDYAIEVPIVAWHEHTILRISIQAYNTWQEVLDLSAALQKLL